MFGDKQGDGFNYDEATGEIFSKLAQLGTQLLFGDLVLEPTSVITNLEIVARKSVSVPAGRDISITEMFARGGKAGEAAGQGERYFTIEAKFTRHKYIDLDWPLLFEVDDEYIIAKPFAEYLRAIYGTGEAVKVQGEMFAALGIKYVSVMNIRANARQGFLNSMAVSIECKEEDLTTPVYTQGDTLTPQPKPAKARARKKISLINFKSVLPPTGYLGGVGRLVSGGFGRAR